VLEGLEMGTVSADEYPAGRAGNDGNVEMLAGAEAFLNFLARAAYFCFSKSHDGHEMPNVFLNECY